jgi:hypothetical protein
MSPIYGCTISQHCTAAFTNYADRVLHEDFAHAPSFDIWYCVCKHGYYNLNDFETHFKAKHSNMGFKPKDWLDWLLGLSLDERFYCGFCRKVITSDNPRWASWKFSREYHLRAHFEGWDPLIEDTGTDIPRAVEDWEFMQIIPH